ncbi:MAG: hypothetical protein H8M99_10505 [Gloeobacteraceae cyanobacterium ES-bin-144]|nr:hypothetical protein [Verrucomicrobiales bacterium]
MISLAIGTADGAAAVGSSIGLSQNTAAKIHEDLADFIGSPSATPPVIGAQNAYNAAKSAKTAASAARRKAATCGTGKPCIGCCALTAW